MGYVLFTARKLMLQNRLNQASYRQMVLSQQRNDLVQKASDMEMQNGYSATIKSIQANTDYSKSITDLTNKAKTDTSIDLNAELAKQASIFDNTKYGNTADSQKDKNQLNSIYAIENQIDLEMKKLDTTVKEITAEMESVEKAEDSAIKASAPKYGGGQG